MATRNPLGTQLVRLRRTPQSEQSLPPVRRETPRGQSLVEFALVLPMLLVLLLGVADFGRVFAAGITMESAARDAAEAAAQDYLQLRREATPASATDLARVTATAVSTVCEEAERLPDRQMAGSACVLPFTAVCIHDDPAELVAYGSACGAGSASAPAECTDLHDTWPSLWTSGMLPSIEVRTCYRFDTLFNLRDLHLPLANGLSLGSIWLQRDRVFTVADY
jgi:hypothetical protein